jgi:CheY-like chemotaxis protein
MRTPLNAIMGFAESALVADDPLAVRQCNHLILAESERLLFQINQVLDLAKLEAGRITLESLPFSPIESLEYLRTVYQAQAQKRHLSLELCRVGGIADWVLGDRLRIEQVLRNLLDNAVKFTETGGIVLGIEGQAAAPGWACLRFSVSDTGIGIPPDKQEDIFEDFVQADPSITRRFGGTGLGTSIARRLVETMGGRLELHSQSQVGSRFSFVLHLPLIDGARAGAVSGANAADILAVPGHAVPQSLAPAQAARQWRCLVVDDFETNRQVVAIHLSRLPFVLDSVADGEAALANLARQRYDLVLLDLFMPGMSGIELVRQIRGDPALRGLPVIGLTASSDEADTREALAAGMNAIMVKPIRRADLLARIREFLPGLAQD